MIKTITLNDVTIRISPDYKEIELNPGTINSWPLGLTIGQEFINMRQRVNDPIVFHHLTIVVEQDTEKAI